MMQEQSVDVDWRTSSVCSVNGCIEVAALGESIAVRDSKNPDSTIQMYSPEEWTAFLDGITNGDFDFSA